MELLKFLDDELEQAQLELLGSSFDSGYVYKWWNLWTVNSTQATINFFDDSWKDVSAKLTTNSCDVTNDSQATSIGNDCVNNININTPSSDKTISSCTFNSDWDQVTAYDHYGTIDKQWDKVPSFFSEEVTEEHHNAQVMNNIGSALIWQYCRIILIRVAAAMKASGVISTD